MKLKPFIVMLGALCACGVAFADLNVEYTQSNKTANIFCFADKECIDVVAMELDAMYYQGLNETKQFTVGTLINRKSRSLKDYCTHAKDKAGCESYKNQLMLKYMTGLLNR